MKLIFRLRLFLFFFSLFVSCFFSKSMTLFYSSLNPHPIGIPTFDFCILEKHISGICLLIVGSSQHKPEHAQSVGLHLNLWVFAFTLWILDNYPLKTTVLLALNDSAKWHDVLKYLGSCFNLKGDIIINWYGVGWTQKIILAETPLVIGN